MPPPRAVRTFRLADGAPAPQPGEVLALGGWRLGCGVLARVLAVDAGTLVTLVRLPDGEEDWRGRARWRLVRLRAGVRLAPGRGPTW